jgi:hypothetical protein
MAAQVCDNTLADNRICTQSNNAAGLTITPIDPGELHLSCWVAPLPLESSAQTLMFNCPVCEQLSLEHQRSACRPPPL